MFGIDVVTLSCIVCGLLILSVLGKVVLRLKYREFLKALTAFGVAALLTSIGSLLIYVGQWVHSTALGEGQVTGWGSVPWWFYGTFFVVGVVSVLVSWAIQLWNHFPRGEVRLLGFLLKRQQRREEEAARIDAFWHARMEHELE